MKEYSERSLISSICIILGCEHDAKNASTYLFYRSMEINEFYFNKSIKRAYNAV